MSGTAPLLNLEAVRFRWPGRSSFKLSVPRFEMKAGETILLVGESGSGKSTLLSLICGTIVPQSGSIAICGTDITSLSSAQRDRFRADHIGVVFQQFNLLPFATVADNIMLPLSFAAERRGRTTSARDEAARLCQALKLPSTLMTARAAALSVGQQQRVAVARALIGRPQIVIADEPTSSLDAGSQMAFLDLMFEQVSRNNATLLMVSHDPRLGDRFDRVVQLSDIATVERQVA